MTHWLVAWLILRFAKACCRALCFHAQRPLRLGGFRQQVALEAGVVAEPLQRCPGVEMPVPSRIPCVFRTRIASIKLHVLYRMLATKISSAAAHGRNHVKGIRAARPIREQEAWTTSSAKEQCAVPVASPSSTPRPRPIVKSALQRTNRCAGNSTGAPPALPPPPPLPPHRLPWTSTYHPSQADGLPLGFASKSRNGVRQT